MRAMPHRLDLVAQHAQAAGLSERKRARPDIAENQVLAGPVAAAGRGDIPDALSVLQDRIGGERFGRGFGDLQPDPFPIRLAFGLRGDSIAADEVALFHVGEAPETRVEQGILGAEIVAPAVVALLDPHGVQGPGSELASADGADLRHDRVVDGHEMLGCHVQLPAEFAHEGHAHRGHRRSGKRDLGHGKPRRGFRREIGIGQGLQDLARLRPALMM